MDGIQTLLSNSSCGATPGGDKSANAFYDALDDRAAVGKA